MSCFYDLGAFAANPLQIFAIWQGGMSFHGGFLGITAAMIPVCLSARRECVEPVRRNRRGRPPSGWGLVRLTNFVNSELWGRPTDLPWGVIFPNGGPLCPAPEPAL